MSIDLDSITDPVERVSTESVEPAATEERVTASLKVIPPVPALMVIVPVSPPPIVRFCILVVARFPLPVRKVLELAVVPAIDAVGTPEPIILSTANLADALAVPPIRRSTVEFLG